jgi:hypothetical protein
MEYARRLIDSGIATEFLIVPGAFHDSLVAKRFTDAQDFALNRAFEKAKAA